MIATRNQEVDEDPFASDMDEEKTEACVDSDDSETTSSDED